MANTVKRVRTPMLEIAYEDSGPAGGTPVLLLHGWPYAPRTYDEVVPKLVAGGCRTIVPYLRGFGQTRFLFADTPRSAQQAALGNDLREFMDALGLKSAALVGYDWGGRAACIVAALWPERARCLVTGNGYNIQNLPKANQPGSPEQEHRYWYQYYFHTERGRAALQTNRRELIKYLWQAWSPNWSFDNATFERAAACWDNPDFVDVTVQSYRHRYGNAAGDPALEKIERQLEAQPVISVPTIVLHGSANGVTPDLWTQHKSRFTGSASQRVLPGVGHNIPAEDAAAVADAVLELIRAT